MGLLIKMFIKDYQNIEDNMVRSAYGKLASIFGIFLNILLFGLKFSVGTLFGSVAITADGFNNLSDAGSSIVSLISIIFSSKPADEDHPYGHERLEYIGSLIVAFIIMLFGLSLVKESFAKIVNPGKMDFDWLMIIVLLISIGVKFYMYTYNTHYSKVINSSVMRATALDSISDVVATSAVLIAIFIFRFTGLNLDGFMGMIVACFVFKSGYEIIKETLDQLLGAAPDPELIKMVTKRIMSYEGVLGVHDLIVHSYGPRRTFISAHAEVDAKSDINFSHNIMDNIEKDFMHDYNISLVLHMDPVDFDDEFTKDMRLKCAKMINEINPALSIHDFRVVKGTTHNNLIFDVVLPYSAKLDENDLLQQINDLLPQGDIPNNAVVTIDKDYAIQPSKDKKSNN